jgi:hypothetical protein
MLNLNHFKLIVFYFRDVRATDSKYLKYTCPIFNKYVICASGFNEATKNELKQLIESEGGDYSGDLVFGTTTHLITNEAKGAKYEHAKLWKINVVKPTWLYDSKKAQYCLPEKNYQLETSNQTSTPTDNRVITKNQRAPEIDVSVISKPINKNNVNATKLVNETENVTRYQNNNTANSTLLGSSFTTNNTTISNTNATSGSKNNVNKPLSNYGDLIKEMNLITNIKLTLFDGIGV